MNSGARVVAPHALIPVQKYVGQRWVRPRVRDSLVYDDHDKRRESKHKKDIKGADDRLPYLWVQSTSQVLPTPPVRVCMAQRPT